MNEVFLWRSSDKYAGYHGKTKEDDRKVAWNVLGVGDPLPPLSEWKTPLLTQYLGEKGKRRPRKIGDSPSVGAPTLISQKAADALRDIWERHAILYPVCLDDAPGEMYYMVIVKTVLDCLDDSDLFRLPYNEAIYYVSERFKARAIEAGLKGFVFKTHFWERNPFTS